MDGRKDEKSSEEGETKGLGVWQALDSCIDAVAFVMVMY